MPYEALPPDPFAGDPSDPSRMLDALHDVAAPEDLPLDEEERVDCDDCEEQHFHDWDLLRASLQQLLEEGHMRPHEPPFDPDPAAYVTWEYCRGFADATLAEQ